MQSVLINCTDTLNKELWVQGLVTKIALFIVQGARFDVMAERRIGEDTKKWG